MTTNRAVVCVRDQDLLDTVFVVAAAAGCVVHHVPDTDITGVRREAHGARLVVLDPPAAAEWRAARLPAHPGIVLVHPQEGPASVYESAIRIGAVQVICLPGEQEDLVEAFADVAEDRPSSPGPVLAVVGGRGGAGASVFAAALGLAVLRRGHNGLLVDCDRYGSGLDLLLGVEARPGLRWSDLKVQSGRVSASALRTVLPVLRRGKSELSVLACRSKEPGAPAADAVSAVVDAGRRAGHLVVCDVPRTIGDIGAAVLSSAAMAVLVVPMDVRSCAAARGVAETLRERTGNVHVVARGPSSSGLTGKEVAAFLDLPLLDTMAPQPSLARQLDTGSFRVPPRTPLDLAAAKVLDTLTAVTASAAA